MVERLTSFFFAVSIQTVNIWIIPVRVPVRGGKGMGCVSRVVYLGGVAFIRSSLG